jgi:hypothetical protein
MPVTQILLAGAGGGVLSVFTSWLLTGVLFHPFQALTPATWRPGEGGRQYAMSSGLTVLAGILIAALFSTTGGTVFGHSNWIAAGVLFGVLTWAALAMPILLSMALFVNLHRGFVVGILLDWLVVTVICAVAAAFAMHH